MPDHISHTESVCPECLQRIPAMRVTNGTETRLIKHCPQHGAFSTPVWRSTHTATKFSDWLRPKIPSTPPTISTTVEKGCPFDCGLCAEHRQHSCMALIEVTWKCNLSCPVCFASAENSSNARTDPTKSEIFQLLESTMQTTGGCNLQFSGGEPTIRDDLPELVAEAKRIGFPFVQINTNGVRAAQESGYAAKLAAAGVDSVFLQFDGLRTSTWQAFRNADLLEIKKKAISAFANANIGIVLVPVISPTINKDEIGDIIRFAINHAPAVRGVHFQPISYFGRYPVAPADAERITLPELAEELERQTEHLVATGDFVPPTCEHALCSFHANYIINDDNTLQLLSVPKNSCNCKPKPAAEGAEKARSFVRSQWTAAEQKQSFKPITELDSFIQKASTRRFAISAMAFQDAWSVDIERLKGCCIHVVAPDGKLVPFCAYNLTASDGTPLYRGV
ncbi:radical SAM (seleno)protein TrsS [Halodesulfovibrio sp.]|uniref:radical SAM (seleno)protein TrsS n=1 Tax=Halodesulfovibrio sp. TaxID=1912772 RepID=UPI0025D5D84A|nr:radical SAM (seleno)protein TrsS [Halodesulfovibrio sp.]MCT4535161.1 radical SAM protein [Halodesulfovibrio sp.]